MSARYALSTRFIYLILAGASGLCFSLAFTVSAVYRVAAAGLNPLQLVLVGTVLEATVFVSEVPTGVVADVYGRRRSIIIGLALIGLGLALEGLIPRFTSILMAQVIWGVGYTFTSGADTAWLADEIGDRHVGPALLRGAQARQVGALLGTAGSVALASIGLNLPIVAAGALFLVLAGCLALTMAETGFAPVARFHRAGMTRFLATIQSGLVTVRRSTVLIALLVVGLVYGMASEGIDRLWELHFLQHFSFPSLGALQPIVWFGVINGVGLGLSLAATEVVRRSVHTADMRIAGALLIVNLLLVALVVAFGLAPGFGYALLAYWGVFFLRQIHEPMYLAWLNRGLPQGVRATVLSLGGQANALGQVGGGPILGVIATVRSVRAALVTSGLLLAPTVALYARSLQSAGTEQRLGH